ncbi:hypothetical protein HELRODRAFT_185708 [Helobdella robusta]|uniref:EF-hand domain-containing protein n=1 Tax=Helobdella robusta TaxID=6412 RepID=T1FN64_HELRO|nr:hypothetical protein HELRODRAFT_185708 [Helobdella robusta]ESO01309.1 hypothetical protein HELRODRAFT_185708 [Helobdella robusta]
MDDDVETRRAECRLVFDLFDRNGNGYIEVHELADGLRAMGSNPTEDEVEEMIQEGDSKRNEDGKLSFNEFFQLMEKYRKSAEQEREALTDAFRCFDRNGDGRIDKRELRMALTEMGMSKLSKDEVDDLFNEADTDDNGYIDYRELVNLITN